MTVTSLATDPRAIWYTHCGVTPLALAAQLGWLHNEFAADGIALKALRTVGTEDEQRSHHDHHLPYSFRQGGSVPAIWARARGGDTRVIGLNWLDEYQAVIALPGSGIRTAKDLRGRRLGLPRNSNRIDHERAANLRGFVVALESAGLDPRKDVEFVDLLGRADAAQAAPGVVIDVDAERAAAVVHGNVDAIFVRGPRGTHLRRLLDAAEVFEISGHPDPLIRANNGAPRPLTVDALILETRPDLVLRFLSWVVAVGRWAEDHPHAVQTYIAGQARASERAVRDAYGEHLHRRLHTTLDEEAVAGLTAYKNFLRDWGFLAQDFDVAAWIDAAPLAAVAGLARKRVA